MLKTYQFKTHCKGNSHSSKTANNILLVKQRWTAYVCKRNGIQIHWTALCWLKQLISPKLNSLLYFACRRNHVCQIFSRSVLELRSSDNPKIALSHWLAASPLQQCTHCRATLWKLL